MNYATDYIAATLRETRQAKGLSQRTLARLAGVPQSHISKIESGAVDLRISSLVGLARALDLELVLVPRKSVPAVDSVVRGTAGAPRDPGPTTRKAWKAIQAKLDKLLHAHPTSTELARLQRMTRDLQHPGFTVVDRETLRDLNKRLDAVVAKRDLDGVHRLLIELRKLRNAAAHGAGSSPIAAKVRPAYSLERDDHGE